jgi:hypothetical protein
MTGVRSRTAYSLPRELSVLWLAWLLFLLEPLSSTGIAFPFFMVTFGVTVLLGVSSLGLLLAYRPLSRLRLLAWLAYPAAAVGLIMLFLASQSPANPLFRLRFHLSQTALEAAAREAMARQSRDTPAWIGLFRVRRIDVSDPEVRFLDDGCGVIDECGLLYRPGPRPARRGKTRLKPLGGSWYHLYAVF